MREESAEPGETVIEQGQAGESFYVIVAGEVEVKENGHLLRVLSDGDPSARSRCCAMSRGPRRCERGRRSLYALDRRHFVPIVSGYSESAAEADVVVETRLAASAARPV